MRSTCCCVPTANDRHTKFAAIPCPVICEEREVRRIGRSGQLIIVDEFIAEETTVGTKVEVTIIHYVVAYIDWTYQYLIKCYKAA